MKHTTNRPATLSPCILALQADPIPAICDSLRLGKAQKRDWAWRPATLRETAAAAKLPLHDRRAAHSHITEFTPCCDRPATLSFYDRNRLSAKQKDARRQGSKVRQNVPTGGSFAPMQTAKLRKLNKVTVQTGEQMQGCKATKQHIAKQSRDEHHFVIGAGQTATHRHSYNGAATDWANVASTLAGQAETRPDERAVA